VAVEVGAGSVVAHSSARVGVAGSDLDVPEVNASIEHRGDKRVTEHMRVCLRPDPGGAGEAPQAPGGRMAVHPGAAAVEQDRPMVPVASGPVDRAADGGWQRDLGHLGALAAYTQHPMAVLLAQVSDVRAGGFEDPRAEQASMATSAKSYGFGDSRAAVSSASNCR
jgi:hypothetical protein